jgi:hypothetical protein
MLTCKHKKYTLFLVGVIFAVTLCIGLSTKIKATSSSIEAAAAAVQEEKMLQSLDLSETAVTCHQAHDGLPTVD